MTVQEKINQKILVPNAPKIEGLTFRGFRGESDYPKMLAVIEGSKDEDKIERTDSIEDLANNYAHLTNCDPYEDMLFAEVGGEVIAYSRVTWWTEESGNWIYLHFGFLLPEWRRKGIGRAMLRYNQNRLCEIAADHKEGVPRYFESFASDTEVAAEKLLLSEDFEAVRHGFEMVRPLSEPIADKVLPGGMEVRAITPVQYRVVWDAFQEAFQDHWGYTPAKEEDYERWLNESIFQPELWQVAWDGDQVAGMVLNFVVEAENEEYNRKRGYTEFICVRRPWRKQGVATALITRSMKMLKEMGMTEAGLGVDTQNLSGALRLYESLGFRQVKRHSTYRKPMEKVCPE
jgi:ribosomal protein S18 acetylase RimI-like enzyme